MRPERVKPVAKSSQCKRGINPRLVHIRGGWLGTCCLSTTVCTHGSVLTMDTTVAHLLRLTTVYRSIDGDPVTSYFTDESGISAFHFIALTVEQYKKLSCHREAARYFVPLNILLTHSRLNKVIGNNYTSISYRFWNIQRQIMAWPWKWVRGRLRSLKMKAFESFGTVSYSHSTAPMAISIKLFRHNTRTCQTPTRHLTTAYGRAYA